MNRLALPLLARQGTIHFMGVGGAGMCGLAELLLRSGVRLTGCDLRPGPAAQRLIDFGATIHVGHDPSHVEADANGPLAALVVSAAVPNDHPELLAARAAGIPVIKRAVALGEWVAEGTVIGVAGTHGKTTTTAMATEILVAAGREPTGFVGGRVAGWGGNLRLGGSDLFVVEADEYDRSFHALRPDVAIVLNLEADHLDIYGTLEGVYEAFIHFVGSVPEGGRVVVCADDHGASRLLPLLGRRGYSYGMSAGSQLRAVDVRLGAQGSRFTVMEEGRARGDLELSVPGAHNVRNALGAAAAVRHLDVSWDDIRKGLSAFAGVSRRFDRLGEGAGVTVVDDYAHHPTEIVATLAAARIGVGEKRAGEGRLVAVFQPHLYSRTRDFAREFGEALRAADVVWVADVYPAREAPLPGITGETIAEATRAAAGGIHPVVVHYHPELATLAAAVSESLRPGDLCITLGAGSIEDVAPEILRLLGDRKEGGVAARTTAHPSALSEENRDA